MNSDDENEEELGGRTAQLFAWKTWRLVTLDPPTSVFPHPEVSTPDWNFERTFTLGIRDAGIEGVNPETLVHAIRAQGYYLWRTDDASRMEPTSG